MAMRGTSDGWLLDTRLTGVVSVIKNSAIPFAEICPVLYVPQLKGEHYHVDNIHEIAVDAQRARGTAAGFVSSSFSTKEYETVELRLAEAVPDEDTMHTDPAIRMQMGMSKVARRLAARFDIIKGLDLASVLTTAGSYPSGHKVTLSGTDQFNNAASDPIGVIEDAKTAIINATGCNETDLDVIVNHPGLVHIRNHEAVRDRYKHTGAGVMPTSTVAEALGVGRVITWNARYRTSNRNVAQSSAVRAAMFGNHVVVMKRATESSLNDEMQVLVYDAKAPIPKSARGDRVTDAKYNDDAFCEQVRLGESSKVNISDATCGYLITDAHGG